MPPVRPGRVRRFLTRGAIALAAFFVLGTLAGLPFAGRYLVAEDPLDHADAIFVLAGTRVERWLEAADLYREGWAPLIVLSGGMVETAERRLQEMGVRLPRDPDLARDAMVQLGIPASAVRILPSSVDNTAEEAAALQALAPPSGWRCVIVVTSKYHTRRAGFAFRREFRSTPTRFIIRGSRYDEARPQRFWTHRGDIRSVTSELTRLALYRLGLGISADR